MIPGIQMRDRLDNGFLQRHVANRVPTVHTTISVHVILPNCSVLIPVTKINTQIQPNLSRAYLIYPNHGMVHTLVHLTFDLDIFCSHNDPHIDHHSGPHTGHHVEVEVEEVAVEVSLDSLDLLAGIDGNSFLNVKVVVVEEESCMGRAGSHVVDEVGLGRQNRYHPLAAVDQPPGLQPVLLSGLRLLTSSDVEYTEDHQDERQWSREIAEEASYRVHVLLVALVIQQGVLLAAQPCAQHETIAGKLISPKQLD